MTTLADRLLVFALISSYALTGTAGFGTHDHSPGPSDGTPPAFSTHGCSEREIHIPIEEIARCPVCLSGLSRSAVLPALETVRHSAEMLLVLPCISESAPGSVGLFASGTRGPPLS